MGGVIPGESSDIILRRLIFFMETFSNSIFLHTSMGYLVSSTSVALASNVSLGTTSTICLGRRRKRCLERYLIFAVDRRAWIFLSSCRFPNLEIYLALYSRYMTLILALLSLRLWYSILIFRSYLFVLLSPMLATTRFH